MHTLVRIYNSGKLPRLLSFTPIAVGGIQPMQNSHKFYWSHSDITSFSPSWTTREAPPLWDLIGGCVCVVLTRGCVSTLLECAHRAPLAPTWSSAGYRAVSLELQLGQNLCCCGLPWCPASSHGVKYGVKAAEKRIDSPGSWLKSQRRVTSTRVQTEGWAGLGRARERLWV